MSKFEKRRQALKKLVDDIGRGAISQIAAKIGKDPSYVSRLLYAPEKNGAKNIGEETCEAIETNYPGWLTEIASARNQNAARTWPFELVDKDKYDELLHAEKCRVQVHMTDEIEAILKARQGPKKVA